jgi:hypothetical protein
MASIFNPLHELAKKQAKDAPPLTSESSIFNTQVGICPKCGQQMTKAQIANGDTVFFCETDRVSSPLPNTVS